MCDEPQGGFLGGAEREEVLMRRQMPRKQPSAILGWARSNHGGLRRATQFLITCEPPQHCSPAAQPQQSCLSNRGSGSGGKKVWAARLGGPRRGDRSAAHGTQECYAVD